MITALHSQVKQVVDHQHFGLPALEAARVDDAGNDHLKAVDAADPRHRYEDPMPCEELHYQAFDTWRPARSSALYDNIPHLAHLVPGAVEDWQAPDA